MSTVATARLSGVGAPGPCFFCEEPRALLAAARDTYRELLLAGPEHVQAAQRVKAHLQRLEKALGRHSCDQPRGIGSA